VSLEGRFVQGGEAIQAGAGAAIDLRFRAKGVYLVLDGDGAGRVGAVRLDGRVPSAGERGRDVGPGGRLVVAGPRLYRLLQLPRERTGRIRVSLAPGTRAYAFTFG
jgi:hypothetical protein